VDNAPNRKNIRRAAIIFTLIALVFYGGFILLGILLA